MQGSKVRRVGDRGEAPDLCHTLRLRNRWALAIGIGVMASVGAASTSAATLSQIEGNRDVVPTSSAKSTRATPRETGRVRVSVLLVGGPRTASHREINGTIHLRSSTGKIYRFAVPSTPRIVTVPAGPYRSYATSQKFDRGRTRCTPSQAVDVGLVTTAVDFFCSAK